MVENMQLMHRSMNTHSGAVENSLDAYDWRSDVTASRRDGSGRFGLVLAELIPHFFSSSLENKIKSYDFATNAASQR